MRVVIESSPNTRVVELTQAWPDRREFDGSIDILCDAPVLGRAFLPVVHPSMCSSGSWPASSSLLR